METLAERIEREGPVNELDAVGWAIRLAKRLEALHALGVFHGSVSPSCVETEGAERGTHARLADVRTTTSNLAYQSPERVLGGDLSAADDAWAVGAVLYALLTGSSPFASGNDDETKQKILAASPAPLAVFDVGDDDLQHVLDAAFARDMSQRAATVVAIRKKLEEWHPDPKVRQLAALEDDEEVSTSDDDERTMLRSAPVFPSRGISPAAGSTPGKAPRAAGSAPRAPGTTPRAGDVGARLPFSPPRPAAGSPAHPVEPPRAAVSSDGSARGSARGVGAAPPTALSAYEFSDPGTPQVPPRDPPVHASAPEPERIPLYAAAAAAALPVTPPNPPVAAAPAPMLQPDVHSARAGMFSDTTDDDEEVKTVMREYPASIAEAARAAASGIGSSPGGGFAPRAIGGASVDAPAAPRPAAGRPALPGPEAKLASQLQGSEVKVAARLPDVRPASRLQTTSPMPALFSSPQPGASPGPTAAIPDPIDDDDLQATVMREMPALPPEVARRLDAALGITPQPGPGPLWQTAPLMPGVGGPIHGPPPPSQPGPGSIHGPRSMPGTMPRTTGPMNVVPGNLGPPSGPVTSPSPPMGYGPPGFSTTPPSHPMPVATQAMAAWNSGNTAPIQPVPPLPGVNAPLSGPPGFGPASGYAPGDPNPVSRPGFPSPGLQQQMTPLPAPTQALPQGAWMQAPPPATFDTSGVGSDPFRQRGRGALVAAIFALILAATVTFTVVRYVLPP